jgi:hypothetical protein
MEDEQNEWLILLRPRAGMSWSQTGRHIAGVWGLGEEFDGIYADLIRDGASTEHATKRTLRELQLEYDLDFIGEVKWPVLNTPSASC